MQYLVKGRAVQGVVPGSPEQAVALMENMVIPSLKTLSDLNRQKKITGGPLAGQRALAFVIDSPSHEEVGKLLMSLPFWGLHEWKVLPLVPFESMSGAVGELLNRMKAMSK